MTPGIRKVALAAHLATSVGWIGAAAAYVALDVTVATSSVPETVRAAWLAMELVVSWVIVPMAVSSVVSGLVMALGTHWGLLRHWWVLISFLLTVFATVVLLSEAGVISRLAATAREPGISDEELLALPTTLPHSVGGLAVLLMVQILNVYKPKGLTPYGWRKKREELINREPGAARAV